MIVVIMYPVISVNAEPHSQTITRVFIDSQTFSSSVLLTKKYKIYVNVTGFMPCFHNACMTYITRPSDLIRTLHTLLI